MNKFRIMAVVFVAGALASSAQSLVNPSFEDQGEQPDLAAGWSRWGDWMNREVGWTPQKDGAALIGYHHWQIEKTDNSGLWQDIVVTPGRRYTFSIYANNDPAKDQGANAQSVEVRLEASIDGQQSTISSRTYALSDLASGDNWSLLRVEGTAPNETLRALVVVTPSKESPRGGAVKFDQASLTSEE